MTRNIYKRIDQRIWWLGLVGAILRAAGLVIGLCNVLLFVAVDGNAIVYRLVQPNIDETLPPLLRSGLWVIVTSSAWLLLLASPVAVWASGQALIAIGDLMDYQNEVMKARLPNNVSR